MGLKLKMKKEHNMKILLVDDEAITLELMQISLSAKDYIVETASDGIEGLQKHASFVPALILTDIEMPGMTGLQILRKIHSEHHDRIVVGANANGSKKYALEAMQAKANDYLKKPVGQVELLQLIGKYEALIEQKKSRDEVVGFVTRSELAMEFGNEMGKVSEIVEFLLMKIGDRSGNNDDMAIRLGLVELITNAIEHGNLALSHDEKSQLMEDPGDYMPEIEKRCGAEMYRDWKVNIEFKLNDGGAEWVITDEGDGFDWHSLPAEFKPEDLFSTPWPGDHPQLTPV
jgi:CheY-like chemotaxis protein